mgnify:CR=1 FL=1
MYQFSYRHGRQTVQFVAGLSWQPLVPDSFKKQLQPLARDLRADLYVYRRSDRSMVGFASTTAGARVGQVPVALMVAQKLVTENDPQNALLAIKLPGEEDACLYLMIRDGFVLAGYDRVAKSDEIRDAFFSDLSASDDWDLLVCPQDWRVRSAVSRDFESFLPLKGGKLAIPPAWRLKSVKPSRSLTLIKLAVPALLAWGGWKGYAYWQQVQQERIAAQLAAEHAQAIESSKREKMNAKPWPKIPRAADFAKACEQAFESSFVVVPGWALSDFSCESGSFVMRLSRAGKAAWIAHLKAAYPAANVAPDGQQATVIFPLRLSGSTLPEGEIPQAASRVERMRDYAADYGLAITVNAESLAPRVVEGVTLPWTDFRFSLETSLSPSAVVAAIDGPGLRLSRIAGSITSGIVKYQLQGIQYAKP